MVHHRVRWMRTLPPTWTVGYPFLSAEHLGHFSVLLFPFSPFPSRSDGKLWGHLFRSTSNKVLSSGTHVLSLPLCWLWLLLQLRAHELIAELGTGHSLCSELIGAHRDAVHKLHGTPEPVELHALVHVHDPICWGWSTPDWVLQVAPNSCQDDLEHGQAAAQPLLGQQVTFSSNGYLLKRRRTKETSDNVIQVYILGGLHNSWSPWHIPWKVQPYLWWLLPWHSPPRNAQPRRLNIVLNYISPNWVSFEITICIRKRKLKAKVLTRNTDP